MTITKRIVVIGSSWLGIVAKEGEGRFSGSMPRRARTRALRDAGVYDG